MLKRTGYIIFAWMLLASFAALALKPSHKIAEDAQKLVLTETIPKAFGDWREIETASPLVNPQTEAAINRIYAQTLSRTYRNSKGDMIMLSIAYGEDQSDAVGAHLPEGCYGGQGFAISKIKRTYLNSSYADIPAVRLLATKSNRIEPITYWLRTGRQVAYPDWDTKRLKLKYAFAGDIPDGLLFRVSSLTENEDEQLVEKSYLLHQKFIHDLIRSMPDKNHFYLIGKPF